MRVREGHLMRAFRNCSRTLILCLLFVSIVVPICILPWLKSIPSHVSQYSVQDLPIIKHRTKAQILNAMQNEEFDGHEDRHLVVDEDYATKTNSSDNAATREQSEEGVDDKPEEEEENEEVGMFYSTKEEPNVANDSSALTRSRRKLDESISEMKDLLARAKAYLKFAPRNNSNHIVKELKLRIKDVERAVSKCHEESHVSRSSLKKKKAMESILSKVSRIYPNCVAMSKKLRAMIYSAESEIRAQRKQEYFLRAIAGRTISKGLHCLSMKLTADYYALEIVGRKLPYQEKIRNPDLHHLAFFSDNVLACAVVVNSTISASSDPDAMVFHIITDSHNLPAITMWFLLNPPGKAAVQVKSIEDLHLPWPTNLTLHVKGSWDSRFTSELNHLRFFLPDVFPFLNKIVFLDHDVVVQKDLIPLWDIYMDGKTNGAVMTCNEEDPSFRRMDSFVNFSEPVVASAFDPNACTWAFGMNLFNLSEWRQRGLSQVYTRFRYQEKALVKVAGSLGMGWLTFYNETLALHKRWHLLGLGYESDVTVDDVEQAAVIHFNGIQKPWTELGVEQYKQVWQKHLDYDHPHLLHCNIHEW